MNQFLSLLKLENLKGSRTQYTIIIGLVVNALVQFKIVDWSPEEVNTVNQFLILIGGYFFAEKVSQK